ncbi:unnamed protein product [Nesidiocoris tenuis]|uniref:HECT-type E3 ubiquitin transferase n=1 Tax=Nesidiocoris tenuis TaxID=355587 RepID=A0A6H5HCE8_9HEMI|nr:unnamed protein product [Nesidiocoris tenuis]
MYSFEGNYRRRPQQNLAGASRQADKSELLTRALLERQKRQNDRRRVESAVKIQSAARGFLTRRRLKRTRRAQFDDKIAELRRRNSARFEADDVFQVLNRVPYICEPNVDRARVTTANVIVKSNVRTVVDSIREGAHTLHPLRTLMYYNLKIVADTCDEDESTIEAVDALKMFTSAADLARGSGCDAATAKSVVEGVFSFLVQKRYFESILRLVGSSSGLRDCFAVESVKIVVDTIVRSTSKDQRVNWLRSFVSAVAAMPAVFPALRSTVCKIEQWKDVPFEDLIDALLQVRGSSYNLTLLYFVLSVDGGQVEAHCRRRPGSTGGGVSREFLAEFMKTAFDPNRGFFVCNNNNELYPNPNVSVICSDFEVHYEFIGRMLGKAIYENILVDVPLAEFFLSKMVGKNFDQCLNSLASIDPDLYRNITKLRQYKGDFAELGLDFTLSINEYGQRKVIALKENGADIAVTRDNVNEYIALVAGYKLHVEVARQCKAFIRGLNMVVPVEWLEMFTSKELQVLISGKDIPIDVDDLKNNTVYTGGYSVEDPTIVAFWNVVGSFSDQERSQLIKFVTSHSRPPLLGFKELHPKFCIQKAAGSDRLPTASTCMNLLKLSTFESEDTLREKLIYAIQAGTGFELS